MANDIKEEKSHAANDHNSDHSDHEGAKDEHKTSKGEKKFKKALIKAGSIPLEAVHRVTLRSAKDFLLCIDKPTVLKTGDKENSFIVFGEPKFADFKSQFANAQAKKYEAGVTPVGVKAEEKAPEIIKEAPFDEEAVEDLRPDEPIREEDITSMIEYTKCSRKMAIHALRQTGGDLVEAINKLT